MNERRPKHTLRRSRRLSQILSAKSPSKKYITPKSSNKKRLKAKRQSNSPHKNSDDADILLGNGITKQLMILTMSEGKTNCKPRRSARLSQIFSAKSPSKKSTTPKSLNKRKKLKAKRRPLGRRKNLVEFDVLLGSGICPPGLKPQQSVGVSRKRKISCNESILDRKASLRSKRLCSELKTSQKDRNVSKSALKPAIPNKKRGSKKSQKPRTNELVNNSIISSPDSAMLLDSVLPTPVRRSGKRSNNVDGIPLDDLLFVSSSRKKKSKDITLSSGICSVHSSFVSSFNTSNNLSKADDFGFTSSSTVASTNSSFKIPATKKSRKRSLKHRRLVLNELNKRNAGHEDDLLENIKLTPLKRIFDLDNESEASWNIATPKCGFQLSPFLPKRTPVFKDCFSPTELRISRKRAEEYMHRNKNKKPLLTSPKDLPQRKRPADKSDALAIISKLSQKQKNIERSLRDEFLSDEEQEDGYNSEEGELILNNSVTF